MFHGFHHFGDGPHSYVGHHLLDVLLVLLVILFYKEFLAISFDEEFGRVVGIPVDALHLLHLCLIAIAVVISIRVVGVVLVMALLTIPPALARRFTHGLRGMMLISVLFGISFVIGGLLLSYEINLPPGATITLLAVGVLLLSLALPRTPPQG